MAIKILPFGEHHTVIVEILYLQQRVMVKVLNEQLVVANDKCKHRSGPVHLCYRGDDNVLRCPWHNRPIGKIRHSKSVGAIFWNSKKQLTLVCVGVNDTIWRTTRKT